MAGGGGPANLLIFGLSPFWVSTVLFDAALRLGTNIAAYRMSKAGLDALTKNLAVTNAKYGI
ncbi:MAG: hypothetical protein P8Y25_01575, partial [Chromatiaceae bacterium]